MPTGKKIKSFKERFSELVEDSDKTITEIAKELHVSGQTVSAWKLGVRSPKEPTIISIASHFGVSVKWLMGFDVEKEDNDFWQEASEQPRTIEAKILSKGIDRLPKEQREQALAMFQLMFAPQYVELFTRSDDDDT